VIFLHRCRLRHHSIPVNQLSNVLPPGRSDPIPLVGYFFSRTVTGLDSPSETPPQNPPPSGPRQSCAAIHLQNAWFPSHPLSIFPPPVWPLRENYLSFRKSSCSLRSLYRPLFFQGPLAFYYPPPGINTQTGQPLTCVIEFRTLGFSVHHKFLNLQQLSLTSRDHRYFTVLFFPLLIFQVLQENSRTKFIYLMVGFSDQRVTNRPSTPSPHMALPLSNFLP